MVKNLACQCRRRKRRSFDPWIRKIPWNRKWQPTPVFLPGKSHGQRSLAGYSPWGRKESNTTGLSTAAAVSTEPGLEISALSLSGGGPWASLHRSEPPSPFRTDLGITACPPPGGHEGEGPHWKHLAGIWRSVPRAPTPSSHPSFCPCLRSLWGHRTCNNLHDPGGRRGMGGSEKTTRVTGRDFRWGGGSQRRFRGVFCAPGYTLKAEAWDFPGGSVAKNHLAMQVMWVPSLFGGLRSHVSQGN